MKAMGAPGEQEGAVLHGRDESFFVKRVVILAQGLPCDHASREDNIWIAFAGRPRKVQQCVLARA